MSYLGGKEWADERVEASGAEVGDAEVDEGEFFSATHRPEVNEAAASAASTASSCNFHVQSIAGRSSSINVLGN